MPRYFAVPGVDTVVTVIGPLADHIMIRRALPGVGQGRLALPGGYQMLGQLWQKAGATEVGETGVRLDPEARHHTILEMTPDREQNLIFYQIPPVEHAWPFHHDAEVSEVLVVHEPVETAFPLHTLQVRAFFERQHQAAVG